MPVKKYRVTTTNNEDILVSVGSIQRGCRFLDIEELRQRSEYQSVIDYEREKEWYYNMLKPALVIAMRNKEGVTNNVRIRN